jgi:hypothetical protein
MIWPGSVCSQQAASYTGKARHRVQNYMAMVVFCAAEVARSDCERPLCCVRSRSTSSVSEQDLGYDFSTDRGMLRNKICVRFGRFKQGALVAPG